MKQVRTLIVGMIAGAVIATAGSAYGASALDKVTALVRTDYAVKVGGEKVDLQHAPLTYDGTTYVPLRDAGEILGYDVGYDAGTITLDKPSEEVSQVTETTTTTTDTTTATGATEAGTTAENIDMSDWVKIADFQADNQKDSDLKFAPHDDKNVELIINYKSKSVTFIVPKANIDGTMITNDDGYQLLIKDGIRINKTLIAYLKDQ